MKSGGDYIFRFHWVLHIVSRFAKHFLKCIDATTMEIAKIVQSSEAAERYFSRNLASLLSMMEVRNDLVAGTFGHFFHTEMTDRFGNLSRHASFTTSAHHREYAILMNCGVIAHFYGELVEFLSGVEFGLQTTKSFSNKIQQSLVFLRRDDVQSAIRLGGYVVSHIIVTTALCGNYRPRSRKFKSTT